MLKSRPASCHFRPVGGLATQSLETSSSMGAAPFIFAVNVDPYNMIPLPGGVCSLKVDWSC